MEATQKEKEIEAELSLQEATEFFADLYCGEHHIPNYKVERFGRNGWSITDNVGISTYDYDRLTKLVVMAHDRCMRAEILPYGVKKYKIAIWKRNREGSLSFAHSTMEEAIERVRGYKKYYVPLQERFDKIDKSINQ